jgi:pimeloyl-ACP methyl ester carboxylesterase
MTERRTVTGGDVGRRRRNRRPGPPGDRRQRDCRSSDHAALETIPAARFVVLPATGHMPQLETPEPVIAEIQTELGRS